jgi:hypothetical protein
MVQVLPRAEVEVDEDGQTVTLRLARAEALALAELIKRTKLKPSRCSPRGRERLRGIARRIVSQTRPTEPRERLHEDYRHGRPSDQYPSEFDRDHALNGSAPFPLLCLRDLKQVYPLLEQKGLRAPEIAERLHLTERTVYRWRKKPPEWMKRSDGETDQAG